MQWLFYGDKLAQIRKDRSLLAELKVLKLKVPNRSQGTRILSVAGCNCVEHNFTPIAILSAWLPIVKPHKQDFIWSDNAGSC